MSSGKKEFLQMNVEFKVIHRSKGYDYTNRRIYRQLKEIVGKSQFSSGVQYHCGKFVIEIVNGGMNSATYLEILKRRLLRNFQP